MSRPVKKKFKHDRMSKRQIDAALTFGKYRERIHVGPYGCGKTRAVLMGFGLYCKTHKPGKKGFLLLGKTAQLAKSNMGDTLAELFGHNFKYTQSRKDDEKSKDALLFGHRLYFGGMHDKESIKRVLGKSYKAIIVDELTSISKENYEQLKGRLRGERPHWIEGSTNPDSPNHWLYEYLGLNIDDESERKKYRDSKNLTHVIWTKDDAMYDGAEEYYEQLTKSYGVGSIYYERGVLGHWRSAGDLVYGDSFKPTEHIIPESELVGATYKYYKVGIDFGMENPTVVLIVGVMPDGEHVVIDERYMPHAKNLDVIVDNIIQMLNKYSSEIGKCMGIYIDPSAAVLIKALKSAGVNNIKKANNDVVGGIQKVNTFLNTGMLYISSRCKETINEFYTYQYSKKINEIVEKAYDHCMDALRYLINT